MKTVLLSAALVSSVMLTGCDKVAWSHATIEDPNAPVVHDPEWTEGTTKDAMSDATNLHLTNTWYPAKSSLGFICDKSSLNAELEGADYLDSGDAKTIEYRLDDEPSATAPAYIMDEHASVDDADDGAKFFDALSKKHDRLRVRVVSYRSQIEDFDLNIKGLSEKLAAYRAKCAKMRA